MIPKTKKCPECSAELGADYMHCTACNAYVLDVSPWKCSGNLLAVSGALLAWLLFSLVLSLLNVSLASVVSDGISQSITVLTFYGLLLVTIRWRNTTRQINALRVVRHLCAGTSTLREISMTHVRNLLESQNLGPYNSLIAYQRLHWQIAAAEHNGTTVLDTIKLQSDIDWDSLESSFTQAQFLIWLLPTAGFLGTVYGMTEALQSFSTVVTKNSELGFHSGLTATAQGLGIAFHTTLVGLAAVIPLLAYTSALRRKSQLFLEQADKFFLRLAGRPSLPDDVNKRVSGDDASPNVITALASDVPPAPVPIATPAPEMIPETPAFSTDLN